MDSLIETYYEIIKNNFLSHFNAIEKIIAHVNYEFKGTSCWMAIKISLSFPIYETGTYHLSHCR